MSRSFALPTCATTLGAPTAINGSGEAEEADEEAEGELALCERACAPNVCPIVKAPSETTAVAPTISALRRCTERRCTTPRPAMIAKAVYVGEGVVGGGSEVGGSCRFGMGGN